MSKKPLTETNPYLKDQTKRNKMFVTSVMSSTAIEGVHKAAATALGHGATAKKLPSSRKASSSGGRQK